MLSQFFVLSPRGDVILRRDYLGNVPKTSAEIFFRNAKFWKDGDEAPPIFLVDGVTYLHLKDGGVEFVATTRDNVSPSLVLELLRRISTIIKDYCGFLSEDAIRKNFPLIYELLDEVIDYGFPQSTSTEALRTFVLNDPTVVVPQGQRPSALFALSKGPTGVFKSVLDTSRTDGKHKDEIFVDVVERVTCTFNAGGYIASSQVDGSIQMKSYLAGNPPLKIKLNDDLLIGRGANAYGGYMDGSNPAHAVVLDDCNFHEAASLELFETERSIQLPVPPDGEFALMNYRTTHGFKPPFLVVASVEPDANSSHKALLTLRIKCDVPKDKAASGLEIEVPMPKHVQRAHCDVDARQAAAGAQTWDYSEKQHLLKWKFKKLPGGSECELRARLTLEKPYSHSLRTEVGPINLKFTIPMYCASRLQLKYLQILKRDKSYNPFRWVRYVTSSNSYTFRT